MANQEHLAILKQGVKIWNEWRDEYPAIEPDLTECNFQDVDFCNINLNNTNLYRSFLVNNNF